MAQALPQEPLEPVCRRLRMLGVVDRRDLDAFLTLMTVTKGIHRGQALMGHIHSTRQLAILLDGLACMASRYEDGQRQIYTFHYPGDFVGLHRYVGPASREHIEIRALATCSIGTINNESLDQVLRRHPALGLALWRAALIDASIFRQRFAIMRRPALQRVAHLLSEQLARRSNLGLNDSIVPLNQIEVADAAGLSVVHTNRILQDLRRRGVLSKVRQAVEVASKARLQELAVFDDRYLKSEETSAQWDIRIED